MENTPTPTISLKIAFRNTVVFNRITVITKLICPNSFKFMFFQVKHIVLLIIERTWRYIQFFINID